MDPDLTDVAAVERAMVRIRRLQQRRTLARVSARRHGGAVDPSLTAVVDALEQHDLTGLPATVSGIAGTLGVDQPRASRLVARAVDEGLVARAPDQVDGRRAVLAMTTAGAAHAERLHRFRQAMFAEAMTGWTPRQVATFARLLTRFVDSYTVLTEAPSAAGSP